jgi:hypothetical protein
MGRNAREVDVSRRDLAGLLGALGGAVGLAALSGCAAPGDPGAGTAAATSEALSGTNNVRWVDTAASLRALVGGANQVAILESYATVSPPDGGGGLFVWSTTAAADDGGTIFNVGGLGSSSAGWRRVFAGRVSVKWFGAKGDGVTDDTAAINRAITGAEALTRTLLLSVGAGGDGFTVGSTPAVDFGSGIYLISGALTVGDQHLSLGSDSGAVLRQTAAAPILSFTNAYQNEIRGLRFVGGTNHIAFTQQAYNDATILDVTGCEFHQSSDYAIVTVPPAGHGDMDAQITIADCRFLDCGGVFDNVCNIATVADSWVETPTSWASPAPKSMFRHAPGVLRIRGLTAVTAAIAQSVPLHWFDNYGSLYIEQSFFNGENAGIPIIYNYADLPSAFPYNEGSAVVLRDSAAFCGMRSPQSPNCALITIVQGCPQQVIVQGMTGPNDAQEPILQAVAGYNLAQYLLSHASAAQFIKVSVDANLASIVGGAPGIEPALLSYVNPFETSPFPMGPRSGTASPTAVHQAFTTYTLPQNTSNDGGFTALVTISVNPNVQGYYEYRTSATYLLTLTSNYSASSGGVVDIASIVPVSNGMPMPPDVMNPAPSIASLQLDAGSPWNPSAGGGGYTTRPQKAGGGGSLTLVWSSNIPGVAVSFPSISIQPIHMIV